MRILVIDVGGSNIKMGLSAHDQRLKVPSGPELTAAKMVAAVRTATKTWKYDVISIGYPGSVVQGMPAEDPRNLAAGWVGYKFEKALGKPVRIVNDAAMQALGTYRGGRMLFLGLGTGLGSAFVVEGMLQPLELAHLPYRNGRTYEDYVAFAAINAWEGNGGGDTLRRWSRYYGTVFRPTM